MATKQITPVIKLYFHLHMIKNKSKSNCNMFIFSGKIIVWFLRRRHLCLFNESYLLKPDVI